VSCPIDPECQLSDTSRSRLRTPPQPRRRFHDFAQDDPEADARRPIGAAILRQQGSLRQETAPGDKWAISLPAVVPAPSTGVRITAVNRPITPRLPSGTLILPSAVAVPELMRKQLPR
jgi:hypothetical protein